MGFDKNKSEFAIKQTKGDIEQAINMLIINVENPEFGKKQNTDDIFN